jgi:hypothetical protein
MKSDLQIVHSTALLQTTPQFRRPLANTSNFLLGGMNASTHPKPSLNVKKKPRKRRSKGTEVSSDESGDNLEGEPSGAVEVMDSIDS